MIKWLWLGTFFLITNMILISSSLYCLNKADWFMVALGVVGLLVTVSLDIICFRRLTKKLNLKERILNEESCSSNCPDDGDTRM